VPHFRNLIAPSFVLRALLIRAIFLTFVTLLCAVGAAADNPVAGRWTARSPDPIGRTEEIELHFTVGDNGLTGSLHTPDRDIALTNVHLQGRTLTFDATRELRGRPVVYHYDGTLSADTLDFSVQNDDGSSFFRFTAHRN
jgi:hypothetical protein